MRALFIEDSIEKPPVQPTPSADAAQEIRDSVAGRHVCPFCGAVREQSEGPCPRCTMENTTASRQATKSRIGPWYVYQTRNPAAPGMKFDTLVGFVRKGRVKPRSIVRGPTTHQLWRFAAHVKGLSREFGVCYSCGGAIQATVSLCPHCNRPQQPPAHADSFLEGQGDAPAKQLKQPDAVMRELEMTPLAADDVIVPPLMPLQGKDNRRDTLARRDDLDASISDDERTKKAEGFLSPADLAAAFNLDFRPKGGAASTRKTQRQTEPARRGYRPKRGRWKWVVAILLLALIGLGAAAVALRPPWRNKAVTISQQASTWSKQKWAQFTAPDQVRAPAHSVATTSPADFDASGSIVTIPQTQPGNGSIDVSVSTAPTATDGAKSKWDQLLKQEADGKPPAADPNAGYKQGTLDDTRALYRAALESERRSDYADAVKKFEQIKEYPPELRQHDLELQLSRARQHLQ